MTYALQTIGLKQEQNLKNSMFVQASQKTFPQLQNNNYLTILFTKCLAHKQNQCDTNAHF